MLMIVGYSETSSNGEVILRWSNGVGIGDIERSEAPHEGFEVVASGVDLATGVWVDATAKALPANENRTLYYRVGGVLLHLHEIPGPIAREIIRRDRWFLRSSARHSGAVPAEVYIRKSVGTRCGACWDPVQQKVTRSKCNVCLGTGFENPYFSKILVPMANYAPTHVRRPQEDRIAQWYDTQVWMSNYPILKPGDLVLWGEPWRVEAVQFTRQRKTIIKQILNLKRFDANRDEHEFPFVAAFKNAAASLRSESEVEVS